jgi:hypothetical protein
MKEIGAMTMRYLEDFTLGQIFGSGWRVVEKEQIQRFAAEVAASQNAGGSLSSDAGRAA